MDCEFVIAEARAALAAWDAKNGPDIYGTERTLADHLRNVLEASALLSNRPTEG